MLIFRSKIFCSINLIFKQNKFTDEYGYTYDFDGPESDDPRTGNDVSFKLKIFDKNKKEVHSGYMSYPSIPTL